MNYFLLLIIIGLSAVGYYEYNLLQGTIHDDQTQLKTLSDQAQALQDDKTKLQQQNDVLTKGARDAQTAIDDLTTQLRTAQANATMAVASAASSPAGTPGAKPAALSNTLGTIATVDGKVYTGSKLLKVQADSIVISYDQGITQVLFNAMSPGLQSRFGYDPAKGMLTPDEVQTQETQRKSASLANP